MNCQHALFSFDLAETRKARRCWPGWSTPAVGCPPTDLGVLFYDALGAQDHFGKLFDPSVLAAHGFSMTLSILTSLAFAAVVLFASVRTFGKLDY